MHDVDKPEHTAGRRRERETSGLDSRPLCPAEPTSIARLHDEVIAHMAIALRLITLAFAPAPEVCITPACAALRREWWARAAARVFRFRSPGTGSKRAGCRRSGAVPGSCGRSVIRVAALATEKSANENRHRDDIWRPLRDRWFESCSLQRRVRLSREVSAPQSKSRAFRAGPAGHRSRRASAETGDRPARWRPPATMSLLGEIAVPQCQ